MLHPQSRLFVEAGLRCLLLFALFELAQLVKIRNSTAETANRN